MKMNDKHEYTALMKAFDAEASFSATLNKLGQIAIDTDDENLKKGAAVVASQLRSLTGPEPKGKARLLTIAAANKSSNDPKRKQFSASIIEVWKYCKEMSERAEPQWQILATRAGWTPPAPKPVGQ
jgi:hypothetical protein